MYYNGQKIMFIIKNFWVTILNLWISYLHLRENVKTGITSKKNFNSPIIYTNYIIYYKFTQISREIPKKWKQILRQNRVETCAIYLHHHLIKINLLLSLEKLTSKELDSILISIKIAYLLYSSILTLYFQF